ncbi:hypothetical protein GCM10025789_16070 [Tessaracoccus lubricantis]|uniref:Uncharacterized protein n=1 Tax=Tessaracoccus lubricantis TaxID=545543 RepID=A0ABP9FDQ4_9ACTN
MGGRLSTLAELESVREPKVRASSRHIPSAPFCWTTQSRLAVESGLEHDLLRELDRDPEVSRLVAQPCRLLLTDGAHVPDIMEVRGDQRPLEEGQALYF